MNELTRTFIARIAERNKIKLIPFDENSWFRGAYSTISRTLHGAYNPLDVKGRFLCQAFLMQTLPGLVGCNFDLELKALLTKISSDCRISIGHSQKLVGIVSKYAFTVSRVYPKDLPNNWKQYVDKNASLLPVPIDAIVLFNLKNKWPKYFEDIKATRTLNATTNQYNYSAYVLQENCHVTWSRITDFDIYSSLQSRIRELACESNIATLEFEVSNLWPTGNERHFDNCQNQDLTIYIKEGPKNYLRIISSCDEHRNDGMICLFNDHGHIWLKEQDRSPRYLIGEIHQAGGNFLEEPTYIGLDGMNVRCVGGVGYEGGIRSGTADDAVRYLKQYFDVRACPDSQRFTQVLIDQL